MRDGQYGSTPLVDVATVSLRDLRDMNSAALRAAMASCLADDKEQMAAFQSAI
ncbi:FxSxx-COOH cyclophane-containing RiPP peptide [Nonomuraea turkmeniaca]|nr:FxSxx-COOH cyclophane-containing RiPP peptide [Nonomuraea turkmeniaca]